eukprot:comp20987_c0_seq1/m.43938 comp20987_c0_seq1/g.43938  ORF comp20987_c0_seq1/g.43938 comp20987_c0_seq1/m.43938 type:complete len:324 (+) comp20987_c0_seq1:726-1697(+)
MPICASLASSSSSKSFPTPSVVVQIPSCDSCCTISTSPSTLLGLPSVMSITRLVFEALYASRAPSAAIMSAFCMFVDPPASSLRIAVSHSFILPSSSPLMNDGTIAVERVSNAITVSWSPACRLCAALSALIFAASSGAPFMEAERSIRITRLIGMREMESDGMMPLRQMRTNVSSSFSATKISCISWASISTLVLRSTSSVSRVWNRRYSRWVFSHFREILPIPYRCVSNGSSRGRSSMSMSRLSRPFRARAARMHRSQSPRDSSGCQAAFAVVAYCTRSRSKAGRLSKRLLSQSGRAASDAFSRSSDASFSSPAQNTRVAT